MEIYQLRYFIAVSEEGNFTKGAKRLHISQPSLSQQILNLEEELGQKLFHRLGRQLSLTDSGQLLLQRAHDIVSEADEAIRELKEDPTLGYRVNIGAIPTVAHFFIPAVLAYCRSNDVRIRLFSQEDFRDGLVTALLAGELDWGLMAVPVNDGRLEVVPLFTEPLLLAMAAEHPLAKQERISLADLRDQNFIMLGSGSSLTAQVVQRMSTAFDHSPNITHRCSQLTTLKSLTAMGLGISVLPRSARTVTDPAGLVYRRLEGPPLTRGIALVRHRRRHISRGAHLFADAAQAVVGPLQGSPPVPSAPPMPRPPATA